MASLGGTDGVPKDSDQQFPPADVDGTLNPGNNKQVQVDPVSSEVAVSKEMKEQAEIKQKKKEREKEKEKEEAMHKIKSAIIVSGIVVAVAVAIFAVAKKLREK